MKKAFAFLALLPLSAHAERKDFSEFLTPKARQHFHLEVDTDEGGFYVHGPRGEDFVPFHKTLLFNKPPRDLDYDSAFERYTQSGGRFSLYVDHGTVTKVGPDAALLGGDDSGAAECAKVGNSCMDKANERYDSAMKECKSEIGDKDRNDCKAEASKERDTDRDYCQKNTSDCYRSSENSSRGSSGDTFSGAISAGESLFEKISSWF